MRIIIASLAFVLFCFAEVDARAGATPEAGMPAHDFTLKDQNGDSVSFSSYRGKWVVLYFYPKDFTKGCTLEAHNFQADIDKYKALNAVIFGVSFDTVESHKDFCTKEKIDFRLLSDTDGKVSAAYGSDMMFKKLSLRNTFLIDPSGTIRKVYTNVQPAFHSRNVLDDLGKLVAEKK